MLQPTRQTVLSNVCHFAEEQTKVEMQRSCQGLAGAAPNFEIASQVYPWEPASKVAPVASPPGTHTCVVSSHTGPGLVWEPSADRARQR